MEIRHWLCFICINCVLIPYLSAKTVSINELLAAESKLKQTDVTEPPKRTGKYNPTETPDNHKRRKKEDIRTGPSNLSIDREEERHTSNEIVTAESNIKRLPRILAPVKLPGLLTPSLLLKRLVSKAKLRKQKLGRKLAGLDKLSLLKLKRDFQIRTPLKPNKLKVARRPRHKRKNQSRKREANPNDVTHKNIPVLKSLGMLFDNILDSDTSNLHEIKTKGYKRNRYQTDEQIKLPNDHSKETRPRIPKFRTPKKAATVSSSLPIETTTDPKSLTSNTDYDHSTNGPDKIIPILLPRNTTSSRRDDNGSSERSCTTCDGDFERNITRDLGDHEHYTGRGKNESSEESNENYTHNATRYDPSRNGYSGGSGGRSRVDARTTTIGETLIDNQSTDEITNDNFGENQLKTGGNKIESEVSVRELNRGFRGTISQNKTSDAEGILPEPIQQQEIREESILSTPYFSTSNKRIIDKGSSTAKENEKTRTRNETVIIIERNSRKVPSEGTAKKAPVLTIFDGYSVTRDKNGQNKVLGKTT